MTTTAEAVAMDTDGHDLGMAETIPDSSGRIKGLTIVKPIVVGNVAKCFGKKREEDGHTHQWTVYLKPLPNEDYSSFIKKVHFKLHDSYANPNRILNKPPYEVTETGWGEFEVVIRVHFNDPVERPVTIYHILKLFQAGAATDPTIAASKKQLVSETYDEIIFQEPTLLMKTFLDDVRPWTASPWKHETDFEEKKKHSMGQITTAQTKVKAEIQDLKEKLKIARETIDKFKEAVSTAKVDGNVPGTPTSGIPHSQTKTPGHGHGHGTSKLALVGDSQSELKVEDI